MRRAVTLLLGALVVAAALVGLVSAFTARDDAGVEVGGGPSGPGRLEPDQGAEHGSPAPPANELPTSGTHLARNVTADARAIGGDELLHALEQGNVVLAYGADSPPRALRRIQREVAGPFDAEVAAAGQAVILARIEGLDGVAALAWRRLLRTSDPADPGLRAFAEAWLGIGASG